MIERERDHKPKGHLKVIVVFFATLPLHVCENLIIRRLVGSPKENCLCYIMQYMVLENKKVVNCI